MSVVVPSFDRRIFADEQMDDRSSDEDELRRALQELRYVNVFLGGYRSLRAHLGPYLPVRRPGPVTILDLGTGIGDYPERMVRWGAEAGTEVTVTAVDVNLAAVSSARAFLDDRLPPGLRGRVHVEQADATRLTFPDDAFNLVTASLFLHHFDDPTAVAMLRNMARIASDGLIVNDLHRHRLAYLGIRTIAAILPVTPMFANDGPLSVRRAFRPDELRRMASQAELLNAVVTRHWAFRLTLSTV